MPLQTLAVAIQSVDEQPLTLGARSSSLSRRLLHRAKADELSKHEPCLMDGRLG